MSSFTFNSHSAQDYRANLGGTSILNYNLVEILIHPSSRDEREEFWLYASNPQKQP